VIDPTLYASRALTVAAELVADVDLVAAVRATLRTVADDLVGDNATKAHPRTRDGAGATNAIFRPDQLPDTHFTRFVIVEDQQGPADNKLPLVLVWECNHDGNPEDYLRAVWAHARTATDAQGRAIHLDFDAIFAACKDYPAGADVDTWVQWMRDHSIRAQAFYSGYRGVPKTKVDAAGRVHQAIRAFRDVRRRELATLSAVELHRAIAAHLRTLPAPLRAGDLEAAVSRGLGFWLRKWATLILIGVAVVLLLLPLLPVTITWYLLLRHHEKRDKATSYDRAVHGNPDLIAAEDRIVQNQLTHIVDLKPGPFRAFNQRVVLFAIDQLARVWFVHGQLGGISSIHFARWVILRDPRKDPEHPRHRLLFFSNYDFSWDSYLGEFVDRAAGGLTAVWSNTEGYPETENLIRKGATDEERFKSWAREHQIASQVWWSGVRWSTVENINNDVAVHRGAVANLEPEQVPAWLLRL